MITPETPGLVFEEEPHEYRINGVPVVSITQAMRDAGIVDHRAPDPVAMERGRLVHLMCHLYDQGRLDLQSVDPALAPYFSGWPKFCLDHDWEPKASECPLGQTFFNNVYWYAGTPDKYGIVDHHPAIVEIKTGTLPSWVGLQLAGQELLLRMNHVHTTGPVRRICVNLPGDGTYKMSRWQEPSDQQIFLSAVAISNWKRR